MNNTKYNDNLMMVYLDYYSYDNNGVKTISIIYCQEPYCKEHPYYISCNGGVVMMWLTEEELKQAARLCIQNKITIDPVTLH